MTSFFAKWWQSWRSSKQQKAGRGAERARRTHRPGFRPALEALEDRTLMSAGALDPTFGVGGKVTTDVPSSSSAYNFASAVAVQTDGKIVAAGSTNAGATGFAFALARYNTNGNLDASFGTGGSVIINLGFGNAFCSALALQSDGKIVVAGSSDQAGATGDDFAVARLNSDGSLDATFNGGGKQTIDFGSPYDFGEGVALDSAGKIVVAGYRYDVGSGNADFAAARLNSDGSLDTTFDGDGKQTVDFGNSIDVANGVALQSDGRIVLAGYSSAHGAVVFAAARLNSDGSLDTTFNGDGRQTVDFGSSNNLGHAVAVQSDGKIVVAGYSNQGGATGGDFAVARLNSDGSLDSSFDGDGKRTIDFGSNDDGGYGLAVQSDGKIVVAGSSNQAGATGYDFAVTRLNNDGSLDSSFDGDGKQTIDFGLSGDGAGGVALQSDEKIVVAGQSDQPTTGVDFAVARLLGDQPQPLYNVVNLTNPTQAKQAGSTIPIQIELLSASGQNVSSANLTVTAIGIASVSSPNDMMAVQAAGNSNPGNAFQLLGGKNPFYQFNLKTPKTLSAGNYLLYFTVTDDPTIYSVQFTVK